MWHRLPKAVVLPATVKIYLMFSGFGFIFSRRQGDKESINFSFNAYGGIKRIHIELFALTFLPLDEIPHPSRMREGGVGTFLLRKSM